jgi:L-Ala-D/L-Glu epimerase
LLKCTFQAETWPIAGTFTIARGSKTAAEVVVVKLTRGSIQGQGECVPYARYNETVPQVLEALAANRSGIENLASFEEIAKLPLPYAARNALDCAFWDLICKEKNTPAWQLAKRSEPVSQVTAYTLSLDTPDAMAAAAKAAVGRTLLKLKLGRDGDEQRLAAIRHAVPHARLIVDANEGWLPDIVPVKTLASNWWNNPYPPAMTKPCVV